jgi:hypothetical protein
LPAGRNQFIGAMVYIYQSKRVLECDLNHPRAGFEPHCGSNFSGPLQDDGLRTPDQVPARQIAPPSA